MTIETRYNYEKVWQITTEKDLLRMLEEELGKEGASGTLEYLKAVLPNKKEVSIGECKFRQYQRK
jgi:hypothetical protein